METSVQIFLRAFLQLGELTGITMNMLLVQDMTQKAIFGLFFALQGQVGLVQISEVGVSGLHPKEKCYQQLAE